MSETFPIIPATGRVFVILVPIAAILVLLAALLFYMAYSPRHVQFVVSPGELHIRGDLYARKIPLSELDLTKARTLDLTVEGDLKPMARTNGTGLPGYSAGWFMLANGSKALLFVTARKEVVAVPDHQGWLLMMSVRDPKQFLNALRQAAM